MGKFLNQVEQKPKRPCRPGLMYWFMDDVQVAIHWFVQSTCVLTIPTMHLCIHNIYIYRERESICLSYKILYVHTLLDGRSCPSKEQCGDFMTCRMFMNQ